MLQEWQRSRNRLAMCQSWTGQSHARLCVRCFVGSPDRLVLCQPHLVALVCHRDR